MFENVKRYLDEFIKMGIPSTDISVLFQGKEVFRDYRGVSDENGTLTNGREIYNLYSCSKLITCIAALKLLETGKLSLEDDLAEYLPAFKDMKVKKCGGIQKSETAIKIHHLFTMTAGLNYDVNTEAIRRGKIETGGECATVDMMRYIAETPLEFEPGESWQYSFCHDVLAAVVEVVSGKRFGVYVKENIFDVLGMQNSTFLFPDNRLGEISAQYRCGGKGKFENIGREIVSYKLGSKYESGGAGCVSTVNDFVKFLEGVRTEKIISAQTLALLQEDRLTESQRAAYWGSKGYGYGLGVRVPRKGYPRTDFGWGGAAGAYCAVDIQNEISVFYAQHVHISPNSNLRKDLIEAVKLDLGLAAYQEDMWQGMGNHLA